MAIDIYYRCRSPSPALLLSCLRAHLLLRSSHHRPASRTQRIRLICSSIATQFVSPEQHRGRLHNPGLGGGIRYGIVGSGRSGRRQSGKSVGRGLVPAITSEPVARAWDCAACTMHRRFDRAGRTVLVRAMPFLDTAYGTYEREGGVWLPLVSHN